MHFISLALDQFYCCPNASQMIMNNIDENNQYQSTTKQTKRTTCLITQRPRILISQSSWYRWKHFDICVDAIFYIDNGLRVISIGTDETAEMFYVQVNQY